MKPGKKAATVLVVLLLAGSVLSVGLKLAVDAARARGSGGGGDGSGGRGGSTRDGVDASGRSRRAGDDRAAPQTLAGRVKAACAVPVAAGRLRALLEVAGDLKARNRAEEWRTALEALRESAVKEDGAERDLLLAGWAESDPLAAMAWAEAGKKEGTFAVRRDQVVMEAWSRSRPEESLAWLMARGHSEGDPGWGRLLAAALAGMEGDLERIGQALAATPDVGSRMWVASSLTKAFDGATPERAAGWLRAQAGLDGMTRGFLINSAFNHFKSHEEQLRLLDGLEPADAAQFGKRLYYDLAQAEPAVALAELEKMQPGRARNRAVDGVLGALVDSNRAHEAVEMLDRFRDGAAARVPLRPGEPLQNMDERVMVPRLVMRLAQMTPPEDTERMLGNCLRYRDSGEVVEGMRGLLQRWRARDAPAVKAWLGSHPEVPEVLRVEYGGE